MEKSTQTLFATVLGAVLLIVGIIGFVNDPVLGIFNVNTLHNLVHILSGALGIAAGVWGGVAMARLFNRTFGIIYLLVAILGFAGIIVPTLLEVDAADNWLHVVIALASLGVGFLAKE